MRAIDVQLINLLICVTHAHARTNAKTNAGADTFIPSGALANALDSARVAEPQRLIALRNLKLETGDGRCLADIRALNTEEWVEMTATLVDAEVALGDRFARRTHSIRGWQIRPG